MVAAENPSAGLPASDAGARPSDAPTKRRRRRWLVPVITIAVVGTIVSVVFYLGLPPAAPFHKDWSQSLEGNPFGAGSSHGDVFVTYTASAHRAEPPFENWSVQARAIRATDGHTLWTSQPVTITDVPVFNAAVYVPGSFAYLICAGGNGSMGLRVLALNLSTGATLGLWSMQVPEWSGMLPPSEYIDATNSTLVVSYPALFENPETFDVFGVNAVSGELLWNRSIVVNDTHGWGTGSEQTFVVGSSVFFAINVDSGTTGEEFLALNASNGGILFQREFSHSSNLIDGAAVEGSYCFLTNSSGTLSMTEVNLSTGVVSPGFPLPSAGNPYAAGPLVILATPSPHFGYTAYYLNGTKAWSLDMPLPCTFGWTLGQACSPSLSQPLLYGDGSELLLSAFSWFLSENSTYHNTYRLVNLDHGTVSWSADYSFTFGGFSWYGPVPTYTADSVVGSEIIYTIQTPGGTTTAGGTLGSG